MIANVLTWQSRGMVLVLAMLGWGLVVPAVAFLAPRPAWSATDVAGAGDTQLGDEGAVMSFDIPSQPLESALMAFSRTTSAKLFFDSTLAEGRRSPALRGRLSVAAALRRLLDGTGLVARSFERGTITIVPQGPPAGDEAAAASAAALAFRPYLATVQDGLRSALCRVTLLHAGDAEVLAQVWIGSDGRVTRAKLLTSLSSTSRNHAYVAALEGSEFPVPPAAMPQPVTLMIQPRPRDAAGCTHD